MSEIEFNKMAALKPVMAGIILEVPTDSGFFIPQELQFCRRQNKIQPAKLIGTAIFDQQKKIQLQYRHLNTSKIWFLNPRKVVWSYSFPVPNIPRKYTTATGLRAKQALDGPETLQ